MKRLTEKQQKILDYIAEFTKEQEIAPTVHELATHFGIKSSTMFIHLRTLQRKNCLVRNSKARSIKLLSPDGKVEKLSRRNSNAVGIPFIEEFKPEMINAPAAFSSSKVYLSRESCKYNSGTRIFAVKSDGSLKDKGIFAGDILIVAAIPEIRPDSLLMVEIDKTCYIGYLGKNSEGANVLNFASKDHPSIKIPVTGPQIIGTVIAMKRYF